MNLLQPTMTIGQIIEQHPETREVFVNNGFPMFADDAVLKQLGLVLRLKTALKSKNVNAEAFISLLEDKIAEQRSYRSIQSTVHANASQHLSMVALLPCPLKVPLQSELNAYFEQLLEQKGLPLNYFIDAFFNNHLKYDDYLNHIEEADEVPDIILTAGFNFFYRNFVTRFIDKGVFATVMDRPAHHRLAEAGIIDPEGHFTVIAVNMLVMVVDKDRLGNLPVPTSWSDLLKPEYEKKVVMRGHGDVFCDIVQLNCYKDFGDEGLVKLGRSVKCGLHPAEMVKDLLSSRKDVPPIHIMPYFFFKTIKECDNISVVWPQEGALAYPVSVLVKADKMQELKELIAYLTGPEIAGICSDAYFPAVHPDIAMKVPENTKFKWLGWDFIKSHDMEQLTEEVNETFLKAYNGGEKP